jgi:small-conductance mechanosensitive channel
MANLSFNGFMRDAAFYGMQGALYSSLRIRSAFVTTIRDVCEDSVRMANELRTEVEQVKERDDVKEALKQTGAAPVEPPKAETKDKLWLGTHVIIFLVLAALYLVLQFKVFGFAARFIPWIQALDKAALAVVLLLAVAKVIDVYLIGRLVSPVSRYNLRRVAKLILGLLLVLMVVSILFQNWYTALVSVGVISLVVGLAVQTPVTSFLGWIYILARAPYRVGDRIKIGEATGDVIDVGYLDTTLWEFGGGDLLSTDHPTGRIIKFPNSNVLNEIVYNYTWPLFPYIWNEIKFSVAYDSDLEFISETMQRVAAEEVGEHMMKQIRVFREILAQTPVDQLEVREYPAVLFRVNSNTWLDAIVRYLVHPKEAGRVKTRMIKKLLTELNAAPDRVGFPKSNMR